MLSACIHGPHDPIRKVCNFSESCSVRPGRRGSLSRPKLHWRRRLAAAAHAGGNAHATGEVAIGEAETGDRTTEALVVRLVEIEARLERNPLQRRAHGLAPDPQRARRQPYLFHRPRAAELDIADDRAVGVDPAGAARAIEAIEREQLAGHE